MVIIKVMGGLGNQMFQYALAEKMKTLGYKVKLDISYFSENISGDTKRRCYFELFPQLHIEYASNKEIEKYKKKTVIGRIKEKCGMVSSIYVENSYEFHDEIFQCDKWSNKYYVGYWQSEKYFKDVKEIVYKKLSFDFLVLNKKNAELRRQIMAKNSVAVHIRGGDYLRKENCTIWGGICDKKYYKNAIAYMQERLENPQFYFFTNDVNQTEKILESMENVMYKLVDWNSEEEGYIDLYLMSKCKHQVIANSSFSWWGAFLNQNIEKIVIAPRKWRNDKNCEDIYCDGWIKL